MNAKGKDEQGERDGQSGLAVKPPGVSRRISGPGAGRVDRVGDRSGSGDIWLERIAEPAGGAAAGFSRAGRWVRRLRHGPCPWGESAREGWPPGVCFRAGERGGRGTDHLRADGAGQGVAWRGAGWPGGIAEGLLQRTVWAVSGWRRQIAVRALVLDEYNRAGLWADPAALRPRCGVAGARGKERGAPQGDGATNPL